MRNGNALRFASFIAAALSLGLAAASGAHMGGKYDCARSDLPCWEGSYTAPGCGGSSCHGTLAENTTTQVSIQGLPSGPGYVPGQTYDITLSVIGVPIYATAIAGQNGCHLDPLPVTAFVNLAGFNLELAASNPDQSPAPTGTLTRVDNDAAAQVLNETQCDQYKRITGCEWLPNLPCLAPPDCDDTTIVTSQATHTNPDGNKQLQWNLRWTAPNPGVGPVTFYLAGNVVNGNCRPDLGDRWSLGQVTVPQAP